MMDLNGALARLNRDPVLYVNLLEVLRRGTARVLWAGERGILLYDRGCGSYMMSAADEKTAAGLLALVPDTCDLFTGHELFYQEAVQRRFGFRGEQVCYSAAWLERGPVEMPPFDGELRPLGEEWAQRVYRLYSHAFGGVDYIRGAIRRGMLGAFVAGELAGFVGFHEEGSIGMLEVLPPYRRRGLGEVLQRGAMNLALSRGQYVFGQVIQDNEVSLALQRKLGMALSGTKMFWTFPEE